MNIPLNTPAAHPEDDRFWRDRDRLVDANIRVKLEQRARTLIPMRNFQLSRTNLEGINLVNHDAHHGFQLRDSDLYRANLQDAHCFMMDFSGSSLMKANLYGANLHRANLENCNLLGTNFEKTKIEQVNWGRCLLQETRAAATQDADKQQEHLQEAEEIYRNLRKVAEYQGLFETAGHFFQKEMLMRRLQMPLWSVRRLVSKLVDVFCGYGEKPLRVIVFSLALIFLFSCFYFIYGLSYNDVPLRLNFEASLTSNLGNFFSAAYFSVVTFTTLGYGDLAPLGLARAMAAIEAFIGSFTLALFVVVFVKKMTR